MSRHKVPTSKPIASRYLARQLLRDLEAGTDINWVQQLLFAYERNLRSRGPSMVATLKAALRDFIQANA